MTSSSMKSRDLVILVAVLFGLCFGSQQISYSQSASIQDVWIERNYSYSGDYYLAVHSHLVFHNLLWNECIVAAYFYDEDGYQIQGTYPKYSTPRGYLTVQGTITPDYQDCEARDYVLYIPNLALNPDSWSKNYYVQLEVFCRNNCLATYHYKTSRNSYSMSSSDYYAYAPRSSASSRSYSGSSASSSESGSTIGTIAGIAAVGAAIYGLSKLFSGDSSSSSSSYSSSSSSSSSSSYNNLYVSYSDIQSTNSNCAQSEFHFYGYKGDDHDTAIVSMKNGHDYNLHKSRNSSSSSRYYTYIYDIDSKKAPSKQYFATTDDAIDAIEIMDCRFCKWFKNKYGRNATYSEFCDWKNSHH